MLRLAILLIWVLNCFDSSKSDSDKNTALISLAKTENNTQLYQSCYAFYDTETSCSVNPTSVSDTCSDTEISRIKGGILPSTSQTDAILTDYYKCWIECNTAFNSASDCKSEKFLNQTKYRTAQRDTATIEGQNWTYCFQSCNNGLSKYTTLSGTTYPTDLLKKE